MILETKFSLDFNDFLQYQLFTVSKSQRIKRQRLKSWIFISFFSVILSIAILDLQNKAHVMITAVILFPTLACYPFYLRCHYYRHYEKVGADLFKNKVDKPSTLIFEDDHIFTVDETGESKINHSNLQELNETKNYIFLKLKTGESIIFPKLKIQNYELVGKALYDIAVKYGLAKTTEMDWKWK